MRKDATNAVLEFPAVLTVEIVNNAAWWLPYVPPLVGLIGSVIVATAAFFGVSKSNRTNQNAIAAADDREWAKWQRETLLKLCSEVHTVALDVEAIYRAGIAPDNRDVDLGPAYVEYQRFRPIIFSLNIMGFHTLADRVMHIHGAAADMYPRVLEYRIATNRYLDEVARIRDDAPDRAVQTEQLRAAFTGDEEAAYFKALENYLQAQSDLTVAAAVELERAKTHQVARR